MLGHTQAGCSLGQHTEGWNKEIAYHNCYPKQVLCHEEGGTPSPGEKEKSEEPERPINQVSRAEVLEDEKSRRYPEKWWVKIQFGTNLAKMKFPSFIPLMHWLADC